MEILFKNKYYDHFTSVWIIMKRTVCYEFDIDVK